MKVPFFRPSCGVDEHALIGEVLDGNWLTTGPKTEAFEEAFAEAVGARFAIGVNSCTAALHLACEAAGVGRESEVLIPSLTFTAAASVVSHLGAELRLADVDPVSGLLDTTRLEDALDRHPRISCIIPVHFAGRAAKLRKKNGRGLLDICEERGITLIEDAAHAFPARYEDGSSVGSASGSTAACFSFYANKTITTAEGGMLVTNDEWIHERSRVMRNHGRQPNNDVSWDYDIVEPGFKYNMPDTAAAIGLAQLRQASAFREARSRLAGMYCRGLQNIPGLRLPGHDQLDSSHAWHLFVIHIEPESGIQRDELYYELREMGIQTSVHFKPLHRLSCWQGRTGSEPEDLPNAEFWWKTALSLPLFPSMLDEELDAVCNALRIACERLCLHGMPRSEKTGVDGSGRDN